MTLDCSSCGACCSVGYEVDVKRRELVRVLAALPPDVVELELRRDGELNVPKVSGRCVALVGEVGCSTSCSIYADRPDTCSAYEPGGPQCRDVRRVWFGEENGTSMWPELAINALVAIRIARPARAAEIEDELYESWK